MAKQLDFETALLKDLKSTRRGGRTVKLRWVFVVFALGIAIAASASALLTLFTGDSHAPIAETATGFVGAIAGQRFDAAAEYCAEAPLGAQMVAADRARVFLPESLVVPQTDPNALADRVAQLNRVRADLERAGLDWANAKAIAFGGIMADVFDPVQMQEASAAVVGNIYLSDGQNVYTIEVSLMNCYDSYVIIDIWQWGVLDVVPEAVKDHSRAQFDTFKNERAADGIEVDRPEHVFVKP